MKTLQVIQTAATVLLLASVLTLGTILWREVSRLRPPAGVPEAKPAVIARPAGDRPPLPAQAKARLRVLRGLKVGVEYPLFDGQNVIGRADEKPVDIDVDDQESPDRVWSSRQHALITCEQGALVIEDLNSTNGTYVNRSRIAPGQKKALADGDIIQIGTVQMRVEL
jgi:predicted component of type VI protein secretion system